jgi:hypothetical protein
MNATSQPDHMVVSLGNVKFEDVTAIRGFVELFTDPARERELALLRSGALVLGLDADGRILLRNTWRHN